MKMAALQQSRFLQRVLGADASPGAASRRDLGAISRVWRSAEPNEPQHLHHLRADVHEGDAGPQDHHRRDHHVCRSARLHQPVAVAVGGRRLSLLDAFYDECANAIWEHDGLLNKTIGDAVMAVFNFPLVREEHARNAVRAAREFRRAGASGARPCCSPRPHRERTGDRHRHSFRRTQFWRVRPSHRDLTAIGTVVNTASRAQSVAEADQILVTKAVFHRTQPDMKDSHSKAFQLKGFDAPIELYAA